MKTCGEQENIEGFVYLLVSVTIVAGSPNKNTYPLEVHQATIF